MIVAEKPSIARGMTDILGPGAHRVVLFERIVDAQVTTACKYCHIFQFELNINGETFAVDCTSVLGHLMRFEFESPYNNWWGALCISNSHLGVGAIPHSCTMPRSNTSSAIKTRIMRKLRCVYVSCLDTKRTLQSLARHCRLLIIATDNDREGESIGYEIIDVCSQGLCVVAVRLFRMTWNGFN